MAPPRIRKTFSGFALDLQIDLKETVHVERCKYCDSPSHGVHVCPKLQKKETVKTTNGGSNTNSNNNGNGNVQKN